MLPVRPSLDGQRMAHPFVIPADVLQVVLRLPSYIEMDARSQRHRKPWEVGSGMKRLNVIVLVVIIIGGLNWLLVGLFGFNLVGTVFGESAARVIYVIVGLAAIWALTFFRLLGLGADAARGPTAARE